MALHVSSFPENGHLSLQCENRMSSQRKRRNFFGSLSLNNHIRLPLLRTSLFSEDVPPERPGKPLDKPTSPNTSETVLELIGPSEYEDGSSVREPGTPTGSGELISPPTPTIALDPDKPNHMRDAIRALRLSRMNHPLDWARKPEDDVLPPWASRGVVDSFGQPEQYVFASRERNSSSSASTAASSHLRSDTHIFRDTTSRTATASSPSFSITSTTARVLTLSKSRTASSNSSPRSIKSSKTLSASRELLSSSATMRLRSLSSSSDMSLLGVTAHKRHRTMSNAESSKVSTQSNHNTKGVILRPRARTLSNSTFSDHAKDKGKGRLQILASLPYSLSSHETAASAASQKHLLPSAPAAVTGSRAAFVNDTQQLDSSRPSMLKSASQPIPFHSVPGASHASRLPAPLYPFPSSGQIVPSAIVIDTVPIKASMQLSGSPGETRPSAPAPHKYTYRPIPSNDRDLPMASSSLKSSPSSAQPAQSPAISSASLPSPSVRSAQSTRSGLRAPSPISMYGGLETGMLGAPSKPRPLVKLDKTKKERKPRLSKSQSSLASPPSPTSTEPSPRPSMSSLIFRRSSASSRPSDKSLRSTGKLALKGKSRPHASSSTVPEETPLDIPSATANLSRASVWGRSRETEPPAHDQLFDEEERPTSRESAVRVLVSSGEKSTWQERDVQDVLWQLRGLKAK